MSSTDTSEPSRIQSSSTESTPSKDKDREIVQEHHEKRGLFGRFKAKVAQAKEERKEREAEKERAKSPPRNAAANTGSKQSLAAIASEHIPSRGRSIDAGRGGGEAAANEPPRPSAHGGP